MNQQSHWNNIARSYESEIFDVFASDRLKKLPRYFQKYADKTQTAIDFGCGNGKAFKYLAPSFKNLIAVDISENLLAMSKKNSFTNIKYKRMDLSASFKLPPADFAFCCNVVMLPEVKKNEAILRNIRKTLRPGGAAVFVLPSLDSFLYSAWRLIDWYRKEGVEPKEIDGSELEGFRGTKLDIIQGIVQINKVRTKHYSQPELEVVFKDAGFSVKAIERLEYEWNTEFTSPPKWMKEPYPWDWLIECKL